jgi:succinate dehydrogenase hydrophobic anchor subunit
VSSPFHSSESLLAFFLSHPSQGYKSHLFGALQNLSLVVLVPTAFFFPVPAVQALANYGLAVVIPVHAQIGVSHVINDYVPRNLQGLAQKALLFLTIISTLGLIRLAHDGVGFSGAIKRLWSPNDDEDVE